jgi:hypothetical protein
LASKGAKGQLYSCHRCPGVQGTSAETDSNLEDLLWHPENEGYYALLEAVTSYQIPAQLCFLFTHIILEGYPAMPLWTQFRDDLAQDYIHQLHSSERGLD